MKALWQWFTGKSKNAKLGLLIAISVFSCIILGGTFPLIDECGTRARTWYSWPSTKKTRWRRPIWDGMLLDNVLNIADQSWPHPVLQ